jgi:hypothetical protein
MLTMNYRVPFRIRVDRNRPEPAVLHPNESLALLSENASSPRMKQGHVPNIIAERGWTAEWKYNNKRGVFKKAALGLGTGIAL